MMGRVRGKKKSDDEEEMKGQVRKKRRQRREGDRRRKRKTQSLPRLLVHGRGVEGDKRKKEGRTEKGRDKEGCKRDRQRPFQHLF